jgi:hypothetical protein
MRSLVRPGYRRSHRDPPLHRRTGSRPGPHVELAPQSGKTILHVLQSGSPSHGLRIEPAAAVVAHREEEAFRLLTQPQRRAGRLRVLRHVLEGFQHEEVHGRLDLLRMSRDRIGLHRDGDGGSPRLRAQRRSEALLSEERRIDPTREISEVFDRSGDLVLQLPENPVGFRGIRAREGTRELEPHGQRHELLLRSVVEVPLRSPALLVLRGDETLPGCAQILDQAEVAEDQSGLRRKVFEQFLLRRQERLVRRFGERQRPEDLP